MKDIPHNTLYVRAGSNLKCEIPMTGRPMPKVTLSKDNVMLKSTMRFNSEVTPDSIKITLRESIAGDSGRYDITASNSSGTTKSFVNIVVLDRPSAPVGPVELYDVTEDSVSLKWLPPAYDGGSPITNYIILKRETTTANWVEVSSAVARCTMKIMKLTTGVEYQFRIRAENKYGISEQIDSPPVTVSLPYSESLRWLHFCINLIRIFSRFSSTLLFLLPSSPFSVLSSSYSVSSTLLFFPLLSYPIFLALPYSILFYSLLLSSPLSCNDECAKY